MYSHCASPRVRPICCNPQDHIVKSEKKEFWEIFQPVSEPAGFFFFSLRVGNETITFRDVVEQLLVLLIM